MSPLDRLASFEILPESLRARRVGVMRGKMRSISEDFPPPPFTGFPAAALTFFRALAANQDKTWMAAHKKDYERDVQIPFASLISDLSRHLADAGLPIRGDPKRSLFRLNRDIRFSANKDPYKTHASAALTREGTKQAPGVLYIHIDPAGSFAATGFFQPEPPALQALRRWLATKPEAWLRLTQTLRVDHGLALVQDDALTRRPKAFEAAPPEIEAGLKLKSWIVKRPLSEAEIGAPTLVDTLVAFATATEPLLRFGWAALDHADADRAYFMKT